MRGNSKSLKGINLTVLERMHQCIMGGAGGGTGGTAQSVRGNYTSFKGINVTVLESIILYYINSNIKSIATLCKYLGTVKGVPLFVNNIFLAYGTHSRASR